MRIRRICLAAGIVLCMLLQTGCSLVYTSQKHLYEKTEHKTLTVKKTQFGLFSGLIPIYTATDIEEHKK